MSHTCRINGCDRTAEPELPMCKRHWSLVPRGVKCDVWQYYRPGQDEEGAPQEYLDAVDAAIDAVEGSDLLADKSLTEQLG